MSRGTRPGRRRSIRSRCRSSASPSRSRSGPVAHGGHCVARHEGRVVFVRHALPGERVRVTVTEGGATSKFWRADADGGAQRRRPTGSRRRARGPGRGAAAAATGSTRGWPRSATSRRRSCGSSSLHLAGIERDVVVEAVPGDVGGLGWRTRVLYAVDGAGRAGLRRHRSHDVVRIDWCRIAHPLVVEARRARRAVAAGVLGRGGRPRSRPASALVLVDGVDRAGPVTEVAAGREFRVTGGGFWQVHPGRGRGAARRGARRPGSAAGRVGAGPLLRGRPVRGDVGRAARAGRAGDGRRVRRQAPCADARHNLADLPDGAGRARAGRPRAATAAAPPGRPGRARPAAVRRGQGRRRPAQPGEGPRGSPTSRATRPRWPATCGGSRERGYELVDLRAFDLFPMTAHVECVAMLGPVET